MYNLTCLLFQNLLKYLCMRLLMESHLYREVLPNEQLSGMSLCSLLIAQNCYRNRFLAKDTIAQHSCTQVGHRTEFQPMECGCEEQLVQPWPMTSLDHPPCSLISHLLTQDLLESHLQQPPSSQSLNHYMEQSALPCLHILDFIAT